MAQPKVAVIRSDLDIVIARTLARDTAKLLGFGAIDQARIATAVSELARNAFVIGADQVLALGDRILSKPESMEAARGELLDLSGKSHTLHSAVALARNGMTAWAHSEASTLTMRALTPQFIGRYLAAAGEEVLSSVGAYQLEGLGIQLFEKIDGDYFSILGLPLLPLLDALRREGAIES